MIENLVVRICSCCHSINFSSLPSFTYKICRLRPRNFCSLSHEKNSTHEPFGKVQINSDLLNLQSPHMCISCITVIKSRRTEPLSDGNVARTTETVVCGLFMQYEHNQIIVLYVFEERLLPCSLTVV